VTESAQSSKREERIRRRALKHLRTALRSADEQLSRSWALSDPDFKVFRRPDGDRLAARDWLEVVEAPGVRFEDVLKRSRDLATPPAHYADRPTALPPAAWNPAVRVMLWSIVLIVAIGLSVLAIVNDAHWIFPVLTIGVSLYALMRVTRAIVDAWRLPKDRDALRRWDEEHQPGRTPEPPPQ
jgi:hypothetical protein